MSHGQAAVERALKTNISPEGVITKLRGQRPLISKQFKTAHYPNHQSYGQRIKGAHQSYATYVDDESKQKTKKKLSTYHF